MGPGLSNKKELQKPSVENQEKTQKVGTEKKIPENQFKTGLRRGDIPENKS